MLRTLVVAGLVFGFANAISAAADSAPARGSLTAAQIAEKNVAARGGLQAWRAVQTISESGKLGAGGDQRQPLPDPAPAAVPGGKTIAKVPSSPRLAQEAQLPFVLELARSRKMRFELQFRGQTAIQVYDGAKGWKLRPYLNRLEVEDFTADELKAASAQSELDGPLVDYVAKGTGIELAGLEKVEGRDTYKLKLTMKDGHTTHLWIDAETFLETKVEGEPRRLDGRMHPVEIYYRDYRAVDGLQIPFLLETRVLPVENASSRVKEPAIPVERIVVEKVTINPRLEASRFSKPSVETASIRK